MKFLSLRPQESKIQKDRLGNTIPPSREPPFAVTIWVVVTIGAVVSWTSRLIRESGHFFSDFWVSVTSTLIAIIVYGALYFLNRGLNRFDWYRGFKRSPLLINVTNTLLIGFVLYLFVFNR